MIVNDNLRVVWRYDEKVHTTCEIIENDNVIGIGVATLGKSDNFSRDIGRKVAMARAMKVGEIPKEKRKTIWNKYRVMTPKPRW